MVMTTRQVMAQASVIISTSLISLLVTFLPSKTSLKLSGYESINLGTGKGTSVLELVHAYEKANHLSIPYEIKPRRAGDVDENYASVSKAQRLPRLLRHAIQ